jgi:hypothetical protein
MGVVASGDALTRGESNNLRNWAVSHPLEVTYAAQQAGLDGRGLVILDGSGRAIMSNPRLLITRASLPRYNVIVEPEIVQSFTAYVRVPEPDAATRVWLQERRMPYVYNGMYYAAGNNYQGVPYVPPQ